MRAVSLMMLSIFSYGVLANVVPIPLSTQEKSELRLWSELARSAVKKRLYLCEECFGHLVTYNVSLDDHGEVLSIQLVESTGEKELEHYGKLAIEQAQPFRVDFLSERTRNKVRNVDMTIVPED
jgi:hypothetical protein